MKTDFPFISLSEMKKLTAVLLIFLLLISAVSCKKDSDGRDTTDSKESEKSSVSNARFNDAQIFDFSHDGGVFSLGTEQFICILPGGNGEVFSFDPDNEMKKTLKDIVSPYGVKVGDSIDDLIKKAKIETGFAAYVEKGGSFQRFDSDEGLKVSSKDGGCIYFAYARDKDSDNKWAFADYKILTQILQGNVILGSRDQEFDVAVCYAIFDGEGTVQQFANVYGNINMVMSVITGK